MCRTAGKRTEFERRALAVAAAAGVEFVVINASAPWSR
jgi:hypothetical protein